MIIKEADKYLVKSSKGKNLGKFETHEQALKRLRQIEWFKKHGK